MPVTTRLLQRLHQTLGEEAANDLFSWWDEAAGVNRAAVREVADLYFARFEARLEKGLTDVRAELRAELNQGLTGVRAELADVRVELREGMASLRTEMANQRADLVKWMFLFWAGTVIPLAGLAVALAKL